MKKKNIVKCIALGFLGALPLYTVYAEGPSIDIGIPTLESQYSPEQVAAWNAEVPKPVVGDWKVENAGAANEARVGSWSWRDGVICITDAKLSGIINHGHAGIVAAAPYHYAVIEANPGTGVKPHYGSWVTRYSGQVWQVGVKSTSVAQDQKAAQWAARQIGKPYNREFYNVWTRSKFYCSQLVWAAYRDTAGPSADISLNSYGAAIHPFELRDHPNTALIYRKR